ncbi:MAG: pentapeptide repeat-containing protein, partial [Rhizobacter sp.]
ILHGHSVEIHASGSNAPALAVINAANPCQTVQFDKGDYEAVVQHSGTGATDEVTHVFAHAGFVPTSNESVLGQWLMQNNVAQAAADRGTAGRVQKLDAYTPACTRIETIALQDKNTNSYLQTTEMARTVATFELQGTSQTGLTNSTKLKQPTGDTLIDVYACGNKYLKFQALGGLYLKSQCGYPLFSATTLDDATSYEYNWDSAHRRLDLINHETGKLLKMTDRSSGRVVDMKWFKNLTGAGIGTCSSYPTNLMTWSDPIIWATTNTDLGGKLPHPKPLIYRDWPTINGDFIHHSKSMMVTEFTYKILGQFELASANYHYVRQNGLTTSVLVFFTEIFNIFGSGPDSLTEHIYPTDVDVTGGFVPNHQEVLVFSFGNCQGCDLTGLDLSNRTFSFGLDLTGSVLTGANFTNAKVLGARFDNAIISGTDFTNADFSAASFEGAQILAYTDDQGTRTATTFDHTILQSPGYAKSNFQGVTISNAVFKNLDLTGALWTQATVTNSSFDAVTFDGADLSHSTLSNNTHTGGSFVGTVFDNSTLTGVNLVVAQARNSSFKSSILSGFRVSDADFTNANFNGSTITGSSFNYVFAVGADFSSTTWTNSSFDYVQAYSDGATVTHFDGCTVVSGSFSNSLFMQSSFNNCKFQGGSFSTSQFVASTFKGATSSSDSTQSQLSFDKALLAGADFSGATFNAGDLTNAIISTKAGSVDLVIQTSPYVSDTSPGASITRSYNYAATLKPASTGTNTTCPNSQPGPCVTDAAWKPLNPPVYAGHEDPNSW